MIGLTRKMNTKKGRPKKKPTYSEEMIMQELLSAISDAYLTGGNGKGETSPPAVSLRQVANEFDITLMKTRKLLITAGVYHTEISDEVNELKAEVFFASTFSSKMQIEFLKVAWGISPLLHFLRRHSFGCRRGAVAGIQSLLVTDM